MNKSKQIDCQLNCKATAALTMGALSDLDKPDRPLSSLINDERSEDCCEAENIQSDSN